MQHRGTDLILAKKLLTEGKLVAIPTETVYGLAANGLDETAVAGIFSAKNRPTFDPLILHVASIEQAQSLCTDWPEMADKLARAFWPGPLTLILPKADHVPDLTTSGQPTVGIRMPNNRLTLELLSTLPFPLAAPSANPFGYVSPTNAQHVADQLGDSIDYILDDGDCSVGIESTIITIDNGTPKVLRLGGLSLERIADVLGFPVLEHLNQNSNPQAPGQLDQHYSPRCKLIALNTMPAEDIDLAYRSFIFLNKRRNGVLITIRRTVRTTICRTAATPTKRHRIYFPHCVDSIRTIKKWPTLNGRQTKGSAVQSMTGFSERLFSHNYQISSKKLNVLSSACHNSWVKS